MNPLITAVINRLPVGAVKLLTGLQWRSPLLRRVFLAAADGYVNRDGVVQRGPAKGLRFNAGPSRNAGFLLGTYEPEVQRIYSKLIEPGMTVYDVGANVGFLAVLAGKLIGPAGAVICFEPLPANFKAIAQNVLLNAFENRVTIVPEALGDRDDVGEFLVSDNVGWGRLSGLKPPAEPTGTVSVPIRRLGTSMREHGLPRPDVIKIDIEGGEVGMLEGAMDVLREARPVLLIELHGTNRAVDVILRNAGYVIVVLGSTVAVADAPWDSFIIATPEENPALGAAAAQLALSASFRR